MTSQGTNPEMVNLTVDGKPVSVPKGTNLIDAAKAAGVDVPYYCYHPHLSVAGNCRMCQIQVKGAPKLDIACNTAVKEGMEVSTQHTSKAVQDAQAATLEFILINHPLDCTVCDQAGHCKLQDYHFEHNARPSRFNEEKEHKVKAEPLGPHVILDGERCIMCTRCIRFCDEVTKTHELGMLNRGDRSVIAINPGRELNNPLSGSVVDLCPVGALTHRDWRFNTRIWFTKQTDAICPGCSTGCNVKVAVRDGSVVQVKARLNGAVNKEWLCDEGRYGFHRFLPEERVVQPTVNGTVVGTIDDALRDAAKLKSAPTIVFVAPDLLLEEYALLKALIAKSLKNVEVVVAYRERALTETEKVLMSPDYAANVFGAQYGGLVTGHLEERYEDALRKLKANAFPNVLIFGDRGILPGDCDEKTLAAIKGAAYSVASVCDRSGRVAAAAHVVVPARSILETSGLMVNRAGRLQYTSAVLDFPTGTEPQWRIINRLAAVLGGRITEAKADRDLTLAYLGLDTRLAGLTIGTIKNGGVDLNTYEPSRVGQAVGS
jgi:NADH-quinone oxidoreductase subunit G